MNKEEIKSLRKSLFLSQQELADLLKVKQQTVSYWERGQKEPKDTHQALLEEIAKKKKKRLYIFDLPSLVVERVIEKKKSHPPLGRHRIAAELMKENNWEVLLSASSVRRILIASGLWTANPPRRKKKKTCCFNNSTLKQQKRSNGATC